MITGVVTTWPEEAVAELDILVIGQESAGAVCFTQHILQLICYQLIGAWVEIRLASEQQLGDGKEPDVAGCGCLQSSATLSFLVDLLHHLEHLVAVIHHQTKELVSFQLAQHTVDIHVIELQIKVGGHKVGEFIIVVLLVELEQLIVVSRHNGKAFCRQMPAQVLVEILQLRWVHNVLHVHPQVARHIEVLLHKLVLTILQTLDKGLLHIVVVQQVLLVDGTHVGLAPALALLALNVVQTVVKGPHQRVVPGGLGVNTSDVGVHEGESALGSRSVAQCTNVGERESAHVHVVVDTVEETLHVDL